MAYKVALNPERENGARRLALMEVVGDREFTMMDVCDVAEVEDVRWAWIHGLLEVVSAGPLTYRVTAEGLSMVARGRRRREEMMLAASVAA